MSVNLGDRGENELRVLDCANKLLSYTYDCCTNEKIFPKSTRWLISKDVFAEGLKVFVGIAEANSYDLKRQSAKRYDLQADAYAACSALLKLINFWYSKGKISGRQTEYWGSLAVDVRKGLSAWIHSDTKRINAISQKEYRMVGRYKPAAALRERVQREQCSHRLRGRRFEQQQCVQFACGGPGLREIGEIRVVVRPKQSLSRKEWLTSLAMQGNRPGDVGARKGRPSYMRR